MTKSNVLAAAILPVVLTSNWLVATDVGATRFEPAGEEPRRNGWRDPVTVAEIAWDIRVRVNDQRQRIGLLCLSGIRDLAAIAALLV